MRSRLFPFVLWLGLSSVAFGQSTIALTPEDAIRLVEMSDIFKDRYARGGCPRADAGSGRPASEIRIRVDDGCQDSVSALVGIYLVNSATGEIRNSNNEIVVARSNSVVRDLLMGIRSTMMTDAEALCLVTNSSILREWLQSGISYAVHPAPSQDHRNRSAFFAIPDNNMPPAPERVLRFDVDLRKYRLFEGRFSREDHGEDVATLRNLLSIAKNPEELTAADVLAGSKGISEVMKWLEGNACRGIRLDEDQEGATYYSVDLFDWCAKDRNAKSLAGFGVEKRTGEIIGPQEIAIATNILGNAQARLSALKSERLGAKAKLQSICKLP